MRMRQNDVTFGFEMAPSLVCLHKPGFEVQVCSLELTSLTERVLGSYAREFSIGAFGISENNY